jgi:hypothetical protein
LRDVCKKNVFIDWRSAGLPHGGHAAFTLSCSLIEGGETNPQRKAFLQRTDRRFSDLHAQAYKTPLARYER